MRLVTYTSRGTTRLGAMLGDDAVLDLNRACARTGDERTRALADFLVPPDMPGFLRGGEPAMEAARSALARLAGEGPDASGPVFATNEAGFRLEAPVPRPGKILAVGV